MKSYSSPPEGLGTLLRALLARLDPVVDEVYSEAVPGMRSRYYPVLRALALGETRSIGDLAASAGVSQPAISQTVAQMAKAGLVEVIIDQDRRSRLVSLSDKGRAAVEVLRPVWEAMAVAVEELGDELGMPLDLLLRRSIAALEQRDFRTRILQAQRGIE